MKSMKAIKQLLTVLIILLSRSITNAQVISCSDFSLLGIGHDSFNSGNSVVHIKFMGDPQDFINYPFVSCVTDCNGDTIATGNMNFFGQMGQSVQSYPVTGDITNACLPITIEFIFGNTNFEIDTCTFSLSSLPTALTCGDFMPIGIQVDQSNTLVNISMQGTGNTYISNPRISIVTDCSGDTIATGFINSSGQIGLSTQGYPITPITTTICYPITIEFIYGNTNFEIDTCFLTLNTTAANQELSNSETTFSIFPNPMINEINIQTNLDQIGTKYLIYDYTGKLTLMGKLDSVRTVLDIRTFSNGMYFIRIGKNLEKTFKIIKE
jgi:hypothetical protein